MDGVRAIFFDIGDTLVFDEPPLRERFRRATRTVGLTYPDAGLPQAFRVGQEYALARYLGGTDNDDPEVQREVAARTLAALDVPPLNDVQWQALAEAFVSVPWRRYVYPGAIALLESLRARGFVVGAISDWEPTLPETLAELTLAPHLDALAVSATVGVTKPHPQLFQEALRQAGARADESVHIGDWYELDVQGARAAGMRAILFDHQQRSPNADCPRVETFDALAALLGSPLSALLGHSGPLPALLGHPSPFGKGEGPVNRSHGSRDGGDIPGRAGADQGRAGTGACPYAKKNDAEKRHTKTTMSRSHWPLSLSEGGGVPEEGGEGATVPEEGGEGDFGEDAA